MRSAAGRSAAPPSGQGTAARAARRDLAICIWAVRTGGDAWPLLQHARIGYVVLAFVTVSVYYLVFILGWMRILDAWGISVPYRVALQAEMVSMLAKYIPGGVWTPAARTLALRRYANVTDTPTVLASILVEAALSAISGVIVFVISLRWVNGVDAPLWALITFALLLASLLHRGSSAVEPQAPASRSAPRPRPLPFDHVRAAPLLLRHVDHQRLRRLVHAVSLGTSPRLAVIPSSAASPPSARSLPCSRSSHLPVSAPARHRCTACCLPSPAQAPPLATVMNRF